MQYDDVLNFSTEIDTEPAKSQLSAFDNYLVTFAANISTNIASSIGSALAQIPAQVTEIGKQFESSMSQVAATMGISRVSEDFELLSQTAKEFGESTKFSASQSADALNYLALAGFNASEACSALPTVLDLAAAGGIELAHASDMVTDSMSALGISMDELDGFVDQMAVTSQKSNTSVEQLGSAILSAGANARILAGGTNELMTELGILADSGLKSAEAGTALNRVIKNLSTPVSAAKKQLEELGVECYDSSGEFRNMQEIFLDLGDAMSGFTDRQKQEALNNIFDTAALSSAKVLLSQCGERFDELSGYIDNADGAASRMADTMSDNLEGDLTACQSAAEGLATTLYEEFSGAARTGVQAVTDALGVLNDAVKNNGFEDSMKKLGYAFSDTLASAAEFIADDVIPAVVSGFDLITDHGDDIISVAAGIAAGFAAWKIGTAINAVTTAMTAASAATMAMQAAEGAASVTALALGGNLTIAQIAAAVYTGDITLATAAQAAFNLVCDANPILLVAAALAGLVTGIGLFVNALNDGEEEISEYSRELDNARSKEESLIKSSEKDIAVIKRKSERYEELRQKYDSLNENEMREFLDLCGELAEILPEGTSLIDEQTGAYRDLADSIDKVIERKRIEALLEAKSGTYAAALAQKDDIESKIHTARTAFGTEDGGVNYLSTWKAAANSDSILDARDAFVNQYFIDEYGMTYDQAKAALADAQSTIDEFEGIKNEYYSTYDDKTSSEPETEQPKPLTSDEDYARKSAAISKKAARQQRRQKEEQQREDEEFDNAWQDLQYRRKMGYISSDAELYERELTLYKQYGDESRSEHNKYRLALHELEQKITEDQKAAAEQRSAAAEKQRKADEQDRKAREDELEKQKQDRINSLDDAFSDADWEYENSGKTLDALKKRNDVKQAAWDEYGDDTRRDMRRFRSEMLKDEKELNDAVTKDDEDAAAERQRIADEEAENAKKARESKWLTIERLEQNGVIDSEKALQKRRDWIAEYCDEYSDEWYEYYQTVYDMEVSAAEDALEARKAYLNDELSAVKENLNVVLSEYKSKYGEIQSNISSYKSKLLNAAGSVFSIEETENEDGTKTRTYRVANIKAQIEAMKKLHETLSKMKTDNVSPSLIQEILNMSPEDGLQMAEYLINSGDLASVNELYKQRDAEAQKMAEEFYSDDIKELNSDTANDILAAYAGLPEEMQEIGSAAMISLIAGLAAGSDDISNLLDKEINSLFENTDSYINGMTAEKPGYFINDDNTPDMKEQGLNDGKAYAEGFDEGAKNIGTEIRTDVSAEIKADMSQSSTSAESSFTADLKEMMSDGFNKISAEFAKVVESVKNIQIRNSYTSRLILDGKSVAESVNEYNEIMGRLTDI